MSFQQSTVINLQEENLVRFIVEHSKGHEQYIVPKYPQDFVVISNRPIGSSQQMVFWTVLEEWGIAYNRNRPKILGKTEVRCFASKPVLVNLQANLIVLSTVDTSIQATIKDSFIEYDMTLHGDPNDYISSRLSHNTSINRSMFQVVLAYAVCVDGDETIDVREREMFISSFAGNGSVVVDSGGKRHHLAEYIQQNDIYPWKIASKVVYELSASDYEQEKIENTDRQTGAEKRAQKDIPDCSLTKTEVHDIADLLHWVETKIIWSEGRVDIGCGNYFTFQYPEFRSREVAYYLCSSITTPDPTDKNVSNAVMDCFWKSVLAATVVGVALWNPKAALIAFKALFAGCVYGKFTGMLDCTNVDLFIETRVIQDWH